MTDREALRRRLYRPGADGDDVAAFLGTDPAAPPPPAAAPPSASAPPSGRASRARRPLLLAAVGGAGLLVALGAVGALNAASPARPPLPTSAARAPAASLPTAAVDGPSRFVFVRNLLGGHDAGLGAWLDARAGGDGVPRARLVEAHGSGDAVVTLPTEPGDGGRLTVLLVLAQDGEAGWSAARLAIHDDRTIHLQPTAGRSGALRAGVPAIGRFEFTARTRPVRVLVDAPEDVQWGVAALLDP